MRAIAHPSAALLLLATAGPAAAQDVLFGYQLGVAQSAGAVITDDPQIRLPIDGRPVTATAAVTQLNGLQLNTTVTANLTMDIVSAQARHGFLAGAAFNQLVPTAVPDNVQPNTQVATSGFQATASYLGRIERPTWALSAGTAYTYNLNAQLPIERDGGIGGVQGGGAAATIPGRQVGPFIVNVQTHSLLSQALYQVTQRRWDLDLGVSHTFAINGLFTPAPGVALAAAQSGTAVGAFVPATVHSLSPAVTYRQRFGARSVLTVGANQIWQLPLRSDPTTTGTVTLAPQVTPPTTLQNTLTLGYGYLATPDRRFGAELSGTLSLRVPTDPLGFPLLDPAQNERGLGVDALIYTGQLTYNDLIRSLDLQIAASAGIAQARIYQPPLGQAAFDYPFYQDAVISNIEPVLALTLTRRFEPVDVGLTLQRAVAPGGFGASAITTEAATLTLNYLIDFSEVYVLRLTGGLNVTRIRSAGADLVPPPPSPLPLCDPTLPPANNCVPAVFLLAAGNDSFGANVGASMPLFRAGDFRFETDINYVALKNDPVRPEGFQGLLPAAFTSHTVLWVIRGTWGRGPLDQVNAPPTNELDAFTADPINGSPLTSARLLNLGRRLQEGNRGVAPGLPAPAARRDSRQAYQQSLSEQSRARSAREQSGAETGAGTVVDEERQAAEKKPPPKPRSQKLGFDLPAEDLVAPLVAPPSKVEEKPKAQPPPPAKKQEPEKEKEKKKGKGKKGDEDDEVETF